MFPNNDLAEKKIILMGLGLYEQGSGISAAKFFIGRCRELVITDLKPARELKKQVWEINHFIKTLKHENIKTLKHLNTKTQPPLSHSIRGGVRKSPISPLSGGIKGGLAIKQFNHLTKIVWHLGGHRAADFKTADLIFQNPSVPASSPYLKIAAKAGIPIVNDWSIFLSLLPPPLEGGDKRGGKPEIFIGVTGTRGKSTTTALIYEMMKKKYKKVILAGNIGRSPLDFIDSYKGEPIVAELSSWLLHHFLAVKRSPNIAVMTNIMNDHLDKYQSPKEYIADKENIFKFQKAGDVAVMNWDNSYTKKMGNFLLRHSERSEESLKSQIPNPKSQINPKFQNPKSKIIWFSLKKHWPKWVPFSAVRLVGRHNLENALASAAAAEAAGVSRRDILSVLRTFSGLPNRLELIRTIRGVKYYNDTTATTPDATIAALKTLGQIKSKIIPPAGGLKSKIILICGGADKKLEYQELAKYIGKYCKVVILLPGTATNKLKFEIRNSKFEIEEVSNISEAVQKANSFAKRGDTILLSPAAASFGLFKNEFDRGEEFKKVVKQL